MGAFYFNKAKRCSKNSSNMRIPTIRDIHFNKLPPDCLIEANKPDNFLS